MEKRLIAQCPIFLDACSTHKVSDLLSRWLEIIKYTNLLAPATKIQKNAFQITQSFFYSVVCYIHWKSTLFLVHIGDLGKGLWQTVTFLVSWELNLGLSHLGKELLHLTFRRKRRMSHFLIKLCLWTKKQLSVENFQWLWPK